MRHMRNYLLQVDRPNDPGSVHALRAGADHVQRLHEPDRGSAGRADANQRVPHRRRSARRRGVGVRASCAARWTIGTTCPRSRRTRSSSRRADRTGTTTGAGSRSSSTTGPPTAASALADMNGAWNNLFGGVARANLMIDVITKAGGPTRRRRRSPSCARCARGTTTT